VALRAAGTLAVAVLGFAVAPLASSQPATSGIHEGAPGGGEHAAIQAPVALPATPPRSLDPARKWLDARGAPLPFTTHEEILDFLRAARVVSTTDLPVGWTKPKKVLLERDGVQMHAIFRRKDLTQEQRGDPDTGQPLYAEFRDSAMFEPAAYELSMLLGLPFVPPAVARTIDNTRGSLQLWVENAMSEQEMNEQGIRPPDATWWRGLWGTLTLWDSLLFNADRNTGNVLIDASWDVWFVDHTRAFQPRRQLRNPQIVTFTERRLWRRLQEVTDAEIRERVAPYLSPGETGALLARRQKLVQHLQRLIDTHGVNAVIFDYEHDLDGHRQLDRPPDGARG
jgi:hypothetical protein